MPTGKYVFTEGELAGQNYYNSQLRRYFSPPTSLLENSQRAELVRIVANCFNVGERNVRTWFAINQRQTPFLRQDLDDETYISRVILAKCLIALPPSPDDTRIERVLIQGGFYNGDGIPLRPLLYEEYYYRDCWRWEFNTHEWNPNNGYSDPEINSLTLVWYYGFAYVPEWLPEHLRPLPRLDAAPFGSPPT